MTAICLCNMRHVRMYRETGASDLLTSHVCLSLAWERPVVAAIGHDYKLVALASLISFKNIVPDFANPGQFHEIAFNW